MTRGKRVLLHVVLPPAFGTVFVFAGILFLEWRPRDPAEVVKGFFGWLVAGYVFALLPSVLYAGAMELWYRFGPRDSRRSALIVSTGLGFLCGSVWLVGSLFGGSARVKAGALVFAAAGALTGLSVEALIGRRAVFPGDPSATKR